ncbi:MAG: hypothetical protein RIB03_14390 [Henriciella sp.]|uniref:hypothetical protein n=1 Tax=Henriciella sp. TaxID=1968823 RepID=UPI0032EFBC45
MNLLRNILTAIWCAVIIGTNVFGLIMVARVFGMDLLQSEITLLPAVKMVLMTGFGLMALVSTKYLWAMLAVAAFAMLLGFAHDVLAQRVWRPSTMLGDLFVIIPTYLLARWNTAARKSDFNPVKEF